MSCNFPVGDRALIAVRSISSDGAFACSSGGRTQSSKYSGGNHRNLSRLRIRQSRTPLLLEKAIEKTGIHFGGTKVRISSECGGTTKCSS